MHLSRIQLNRRRRGFRWLLANPQRLHAAVLAAFPEPPTGDLRGEPRVLWRLDQDGDRVFLYVVSPHQPDFSHLAEQAGWPTTEPGESRDYSPFLDRLNAGQQWAFRITANPTRYRPGADGQRAKRIAHVTVGHQERWLMEKSDACGFRLTATPVAGSDGGASVPNVAVTRRLTHRFRRGEVGAPVTIATAQFDGRLEVLDPNALRNALTAGIGSAKAYGCGLMTLARP